MNGILRLTGNTKMAKGVAVCAVFCLLLSAQFHSACARDSNASGAVVFSFMSNVGPLNPHLYSPNQMFAQEMLYEGLVDLGENGGIVPALAERWEVSADGLEYRFHLRSGVSFSDGEPFDADVVVKNFTAIMENAKRHAWLPLTEKIENFHSQGPSTFILRLKSPYYPVLDDLALPRPFRMLSPAAFPDDGKTRTGIKKAVGTGPWKLSKTALGEYDLFERNENYWGEKAKEAKVLVRVIPDPQSRSVALETGEIDLIYGIGQISYDAFSRFRSDAKYVTAVSTPVGGMALAINSGRGPTSELAVRQALQHAANKDAIIQGILLGTQTRADTLFSPLVPYCGVPLEPYAFDTAKAAALLDSAGWLLVEKGRFRSKNGQELAIDFCFVGNDAVQKSIGEVLQAQYAKAGIRLNLVGEEEDSFLRRQKDGNFGMIFNSTWGPPFEPHAMVGSMLLPSHADYMAQAGLPMKAGIDKKIEAVLSATDIPLRQALYTEILTTLHQQAVYLPVFYFSSLSVHRKDALDGVHFAPGRTRIPFESFTRP